MSQNSPTENMHPFLKLEFDCYAFQLTDDYPGRKIRRAAVYASAIPAFARLGYIELVDARAALPKDIPEFLIGRIKRTKRQPIWIPSRNFPINPLDLNKEMQPYIWDDAIFWRHTPSNCNRISQIENPKLWRETWRESHFRFVTHLEHCGLPGNVSYANSGGSP